MSPMRIIILVVAAVSAIGLAFVVRGLSGGQPEAAAAPVVEKPMAKVLVAGRDLAIGARITPQDLDWQEWPLEAVNEAYITDGSVALPQAVKTEDEIDAEKAAEKDRLADVEADAARAERKAKKDGKTPEQIKAAGEKVRAAGKAATPGGPPGLEGAEANAREVAGAARNLFGEGGPMEALTGAVVREVFLKGEPITERKLVRAGEAGVMAVTLNPGMRAMSIPVAVESAAGGFILPGDRVDVVLSRQVQNATGAGGSNDFRSETVMRNVKVLAIDQTLKAEDGAQSVVGATATLEVGANDAEALALADAQGDLALVLRSYADVGGPSGKTARPDLLRSNTQANATTMVRVWRNGEATSVAVQ